jgi:hypothetical protein
VCTAAAIVLGVSRCFAGGGVAVEGKNLKQRKRNEFDHATTDLLQAESTQKMTPAQRKERGRNVASHMARHAPAMARSKRSCGERE